MQSASLHLYENINTKLLQNSLAKNKKSQQIEYNRNRAISKNNHTGFLII